VKSHQTRKELLAEIDEYDALLGKLGKTLTRIANALNGPPPPLTHWSYHDLADKTEKLVADLAAKQEILDEIRSIPNWRNPETGEGGFDVDGDEWKLVHDALRGIKHPDPALPRRPKRA
jgi:hypothetical protein